MYLRKDPKEGTVLLDVTNRSARSSGLPTGFLSLLFFDPLTPCSRLLPAMQDTSPPRYTMVSSRLLIQLPETSVPHRCSIPFLLVWCHHISTPRCRGSSQPRTLQGMVLSRLRMMLYFVGERSLSEQGGLIKWWFEAPS